MVDRNWLLNERCHPMTVDTLINCIMEIAGAARSLTEWKELLGADGGWRVVQAIVRQMSVPLRKLCIADEGSLLKRVILNPSFPPLGGTKGRYRQAKIMWQTPRREYVFEFQDGRKDTVVVPEAKHGIEIGRLYGVEFLEEGWCMLRSPFDLVSDPVEMDDWLNMKVLQVNSVEYTLRDAVKTVADYEGAHTNELPAWIAVGVNPEDIDKGRTMKYRLANSVNFGCLSYLQVIALFTGFVVLRKTQELLRVYGGHLNGVDVSILDTIIRGISTDFSSRARLMRNCHEMIVYRKSDANPPIRTRRPAYRLWSGSRKMECSNCRRKAEVLAA